MFTTLSLGFSNSNCPVPDVNELHQVIVGLQEENDSIADELNDMRNYSEQIRLQVRSSFNLKIYSFTIDRNC